MRKAPYDLRSLTKRLSARSVQAVAATLWLVVAGCASADPTGPGGTSASIEVRGTLIYVDAQRGDDQNPGTLQAPFATIGWALDHTQGEVTVYVAGGTYPEVLAPRANVHIYGGFDGSTWDRTGQRTVVGVMGRAARIMNVGNVTLDGLALVAGDAGGADRNSIAVTVHASYGVTISDNDLVAGRGLAGQAGVDRSRPSKGSNGGTGQDDAICGTDLNKGGAGGGASTTRGGGAGGAGKAFLGYDGKDGKGPKGGAGGSRGDADAAGHDGKNGGAGSDGSDGDGGSALGQITGGTYIPASGASGQNGTNGSGGGGGGAGSGLATGACGSAGGGGGQGGAGGQGGTGGSGGGGSFGVVVTGNSQVKVTGNRIETAGGGDGGRGGSGAAGGAGGSGGSGGSKLFSGYDGGDGGNGGSGGRGGNGGGGGGGPSIGIATDGMGSLTYSSNTFDLGPAGTGGTGGGKAGADGITADVHGVG